MPIEGWLEDFCSPTFSVSW